MAVSREELQLAARNHGMPLEALRWPVTPVGLHYLLIHYDIPQVDPATWRLRVGGRVREPLDLSLDDLRERPAVTRPVTMECAGNGRALLEPHVVSQPWLSEAVGTAEWTGVPVRDVARGGRRRGRRDRGAVHGPRPRRRGRDRAVLPAQPAARRGARRAAARLRGQRRAAAAAARLPAAAAGPRLVRDDERQVAGEPGGARRAVRGLPAGGRLPDARQRGRPRDARHADHAASADGAAGDPRLHDPPAPRGRRPVHARGARVVRLGRDRVGRGVRRRRRELGAGGAGEEPPPGAWRGWTFTWDARPGEHELCARASDAAGNRQPASAAWNVGGYANTSVQRVPVTVR